MAKYTKAEKEEALEKLRAMCPPGTKIYTTVKHVSKSGMTRDISCYIVQEHGIQWIGWYVARILGTRLMDNGAVRVGGCGMDMGFHIVNSLSYALHGHTNHNVENDDVRHTYINKPTPNNYVSGYSLKHEWI